jgi:hypothetical protein
MDILDGVHMIRIPWKKAGVFAVNTTGIIILFVAYILASRNPDFSIVISFNDYGEAFFELAAILIALALSIQMFIQDARGARVYNRL